jgi:serine/alanine adding enzyme
VEASAALTDGEPRLLHLGGPGGDVIFACLLRSDPPDVATPYGYGGPLPVGDDPPVAAFAEAYDRWAAARGVVTSFVVHHPVQRTHAHASISGQRMTALAGTIGWPLGDEDLLAGMHKHHRRLARRAANEGLTTTVTPEPDDLSSFVALYEAAMRRMDADPFYLFPSSYWEALRRDVPLVRVDVHDAGGRHLAGLLGMGAPPTLHYHLGAAAPEGLGTGAPHLAMLTLARWGQANGFACLHLGGGVGGRDDTLLRYKRRFAPEGLLEARIGKAVHDPAAYAVLTGRTEVDWDGFFPAYRARPGTS